MPTTAATDVLADLISATFAVTSALPVGANLLVPGRPGFERSFDSTRPGANRVDLQPFATSLDPAARRERALDWITRTATDHGLSVSTLATAVDRWRPSLARSPRFGAFVGAEQVVGDHTLRRAKIYLELAPDLRVDELPLARSVEVAATAPFALVPEFVGLAVGTATVARVYLSSPEPVPVTALGRHLARVGVGHDPAWLDVLAGDSPGFAPNHLVVGLRTLDEEEPAAEVEVVLDAVRPPGATSAHPLLLAETVGCRAQLDRWPHRDALDDWTVLRLRLGRGRPGMSVYVPVDPDTSE